VVLGVGDVDVVCVHRHPLRRIKLIVPGTGRAGGSQRAYIGWRSRIGDVEDLHAMVVGVGHVEQVAVDGNVSWPAQLGIARPARAAADGGQVVAAAVENLHAVVAVVAAPVAAVADVDVASAVKGNADGILELVISWSRVPSLPQFQDDLAATVILDDVRCLRVYHPDITAVIFSDIGDASQRCTAVVYDAGLADLLQEVAAGVELEDAVGQRVGNPHGIPNSANTFHPVKVVVCLSERLAGHPERLHVAEAQPRLAEGDGGGPGALDAMCSERLGE
jgi:hypothetical protein